MKYYNKTKSLKVKSKEKNVFLFSEVNYVGKRK